MNIKVKAMLLSVPILIGLGAFQQTIQAAPTISDVMALNKQSSSVVGDASSSIVEDSAKTASDATETNQAAVVSADTKKDSLDKKINNTKADKTVTTTTKADTATATTGNKKVADKRTGLKAVKKSGAAVRDDTSVIFMNGIDDDVEYPTELSIADLDDDATQSYSGFYSDEAHGAELGLKDVLFTATFTDADGNKQDLGNNDSGLPRNKFGLKTLSDDGQQASFTGEVPDKLFKIGKNTYSVVAERVADGVQSTTGTATTKVTIPAPVVDLDDDPTTVDVPTADPQYTLNYTVKANEYATKLTTYYKDSVTGKEVEMGSYDNTDKDNNHKDNFTMKDLAKGDHTMTVYTKDDQKNTSDVKTFKIHVADDVVVKPTLQINSISNLNFGEAIKIPSETTVMSPQAGLNVNLAAVNAGGWKLKVATDGLKGTDGSTDPNALIFKSDSKDNGQVIDGTGVDVTTGTGVKDSIDTTYEAGTGVLLKADPAQLKAQTYKAKLDWTLVSAP
ncbi:hypothetical protein ACVQ8P_01975 [Dellaglioa sp. BT-FLS60]